MTSITKYSDDKLRRALKQLSQQDRDVLVEIIRHIAELARRRVYVDWGYSTLWDFCCRELRWSGGSAHRRIAVAKFVSSYEPALSYLQDGRISFCVMSVLTTCLTPANAKELLEKAVGMSKREAEDLVILATGKAIGQRDRIRFVGIKSLEDSGSGALLAQDTALDAPQVPTHGVDAAGQSGTQTAPAEPAGQSVDGQRVHRIAFDADEQVVTNIKRLQEVLGKRDLNDIMLRASESLLDKVDPLRRHERRLARRTAQAAQETLKASKQAGLKQTITKTREFVNLLRHRQPLALRDAVVARDGAQCTYISKEGVRCGARAYLHVDHIRPFALGGSSTDADNNRVLCAAHNLRRAAKHSRSSISPPLREQEERAH